MALPARRALLIASSLIRQSCRSYAGNSTVTDVGVSVSRAAVTVSTTEALPRAASADLHAWLSHRAFYTCLTPICQAAAGPVTGSRTPEVRALQTVAGDLTGPTAGQPQRLHTEAVWPPDEQIELGKVASAQTVLQTLSNAEFIQVLQKEAQQRHDMSFKEWESLCLKAGVAHSNSEAVQLLQKMAAAGVVLHFQERVYLDPREIAESILSTFAALHDGGDASTQKLAAQLRELEVKKEVAEVTANRRANWFLYSMCAAMFGQFSVFAWLTFTEPGWDVMEPITFFWAYFTGLLCYVYFLLTRQEFTWVGFRESLLRRELQRTASEHNLDLREYEKLLEKMQRYRRMAPRIVK